MIMPMLSLGSKPFLLGSAREISARTHHYWSGNLGHLVDIEQICGRWADVGDIRQNFGTLARNWSPLHFL